MPIAIRAVLFLIAVLAAAPAAAEPALWRLADEDTQMFLFGSVHILPPETEWRSDALEAALEGADAVVFETDLHPAAGGPADRLAEANTWLPRGETVHDYLSAEDSARLADAARAVGVAPAAIAPMRPWMASLLLSLRFAESQGWQADAGVDGVLMAAARAGGKRLIYLEAPEDQIALFAGLKRDVEIRMLATTAREILETPDILDAMGAAWTDGDLAVLSDLTVESMQDETPELYAAAMVGRNQAWIPALEELMGPPGQVLVVVGAAHLIGPDGLPHLLSERGFTVERVR